MRQIGVGVIGVGWCGGIRAIAAANSPLVRSVHLAEIKPDRLDEIAQLTKAASSTTDYTEMVATPDVDAIIISATPETLHYPMARESLLAGKHVLMDKPISLTLAEADELIELAQQRQLKFSIGYSQRFNPKQALIKHSLEQGAIGDVVSVLISRHLTRVSGGRVGSRTNLSPASMVATHDIDFALWCLEPARAKRVYAQEVWGAMKSAYDVADGIWTMMTMDNGVVVTIGGGWTLPPPTYLNYCSTWLEFVGTDGALLIDDTHRDTVLHTTRSGSVFPISSMPGEQIGHLFVGPMEQETLHFLEAAAHDRDVLVTSSQARRTMEVYLAADLSAERNEPIALPLDAD